MKDVPRLPDGRPVIREGSLLPQAFYNFYRDCPPPESYSSFEAYLIASKKLVKYKVRQSTEYYQSIELYSGIMQCARTLKPLLLRYGIKQEEIDRRLKRGRWPITIRGIRFTRFCEKRKRKEGVYVYKAKDPFNDTTVCDSLRDLLNLRGLTGLNYNTLSSWFQRGRNPIVYNGYTITREGREINKRQKYFQKRRRQQREAAVKNKVQRAYEEEFNLLNW